jgi:hypothetical protein
MNRLRLSVVAPLAVLILAGGVRADLRSDAPQVSLGEVKAGRPLSYRFTFVNRGSDVVQITAVQPSCGCLQPQLGERRLQPGGTGVLVLGVNTLTAPAGPNAWRVQILYSAGGRADELTLTLRATVVSEITVQPAALVLQTENSLSHEVTLTDARQTPISVTELRTTAPLLRASLRESHLDETSRKVLTVKLDVEPGFPEGRHDETLQIFTSDPEYPELRVPVTVVKQTRSAVHATPPEVTIQATAGPLPSRVVLLRGSDDLDVEVDRVEADDPAVFCTRAKGPGNMATLRVKIDGSRVGADGLHTAIHVYLARPKGEQVTIPVHCSAR